MRAQSRKHWALKLGLLPVLNSQMLKLRLGKSYTLPKSEGKLGLNPGFLEHDAQQRLPAVSSVERGEGEAGLDGQPELRL